MKKVFYFIVLYAICYTICAITERGTEDQDIQQHKIEELENEKLELYQLINEAIRDTISTLQKSNDSEAREGIVYMRELLRLITEFNGTELLTPVDILCTNVTDLTALNEVINTNIGNSSDPHQDGRRRKTGNKMQSISNSNGFEHIKHAILNYSKIDKKGIKTNETESQKEKKIKEMLELQLKLDKWMEQRKREKERIRKYKLGLAATSRVDYATENCPDFGEGRSKPTKLSAAKNARWPCCRKCCKRSYMGCL